MKNKSAQMIAFLEEQITSYRCNSDDRKIILELLDRTENDLDGYGWKIGRNPCQSENT